MNPSFESTVRCEFLEELFRDHGLRLISEAPSFCVRTRSEILDGFRGRGGDYSWVFYRVLHVESMSDDGESGTCGDVVRVGW